MPDLVLYHFPGACSQVCVFALEQTGLKYELRLIDLSTNEQSSPAYYPISSLGKVPAMMIDGVVLTENAAIQTYIAELRPEAGLFPEDRSPLAMANRQAGFSFCGGTLHPIVRGLRNPRAAHHWRRGTGAPAISQACGQVIRICRKALGHAVWLVARRIFDHRCLLELDHIRCPAWRLRLFAVSNLGGTKGSFNGAAGLCPDDGKGRSGTRGSRAT